MFINYILPSYQTGTKFSAFNIMPFDLITKSRYPVRLLEALLAFLKYKTISMKNVFVFFYLLLSISMQATVFEVGTGKAYSSPNALDIANTIQPGDTILIEGEEYSGQESLAEWDMDNLLIRGVNGRPHMCADGSQILGKGIWVLSGNNIIVENIEFSEAKVNDENGAGIRLDGIGLTVRYCYFHHNENGILTSNPGTGDILIEFTEFNQNGFGDGFTHNLYVGRINKLTFQFNYSHHTDVGHNLKTRAKENYILYNRIMDEEMGNSSRLIDVSNGGICFIIGNLLMQGTEAENNNLIGYGREGLSAGSTHELFLINNTCVNKRVASCIFIDIENGTSKAQVINNVFAGTGTLINGTTTSESNNYINTDIGSLNFVNETGFNYQLTSTSPPINFGVALGSENGFALEPVFGYEHPLSASARSVNDDNIDAGAYEYGLTTGTGHIVTDDQSISIFPNPFLDKVIVNGRIENFEVKVMNQMGQEVGDFSGTGEPLYIDLSNFASGIYFISIQHNGKASLSLHKIIKS